MKAGALLALSAILSCSSGTYSSSARSLDSLKSSDVVLTMYRDERLKPLVVGYFSKLTESRSIAETVLEICSEKDIPPTLAFAIAWNESHFNPKAINYNRSSVDRGLFQLNSRTFAELGREAMYDPRTNSHHALDYLKEGLDRTGDVEKALCFYNSGMIEAKGQRVPRSSKVYAKSVLSDRDCLDKGVFAWIYFSQDPRLTLD